MQVHQAEVRPQTEQAVMTSQGFATMAGWWNARVRAAMISWAGIIYRSAL
jgi:hypothetical protein